jgi:3-oxoacyl-[acyl-carrier protein] reductase
MAGKCTGKVAIVSGGGQGIGFAIAKALAREGAAVILAQRTIERAQAAAAQLCSEGVDAKAAGLDVTDGGSVDALVGDALTRYGHIDILVNNAGCAGTNGPFLQLNPAVWRQVVDTNLTGSFLCGQAVARAMTAHGTRGSIVNIGSLNSFSAQKDAAAYAASKGGVLMLTKAMAVDLAPYGIRVNCLAPGSILVERNAPLFSAEPVKSGLAKAIPLGGPGSVEHVAAAALFLASDDSAFMTGATLVIDGGYLAYARIE